MSATTLKELSEARSSILPFGMTAGLHVEQIALPRVTVTTAKAGAIGVTQVQVVVVAR